jgi:hypothetical protein
LRKDGFDDEVYWRGGPVVERPERSSESLESETGGVTETLQKISFENPW